MTRVELVGDVCRVLVGHLEALMEEPADDPAVGPASKHTSDQGQAASGDRRDQAEGDADPHASLAGRGMAREPSGGLSETTIRSMRITSQAA
ncbi:hypothetical protein ACFYWY_19620 [Streptomyces sp. NPDC002870]|uniref:hypothetical protein n=1 Tax=Streptomyces sp. NPDC002870 TaxID=3364666 RepID=UPI003691E2F5